jgi:ATP-dependent RNA helicase DDX1
MPEIVKAVDELGWILPTDVQAEAVPLILGGGDVLMVGTRICICIYICRLYCFCRHELSNIC